MSLAASLSAPVAITRRPVAPTAVMIPQPAEDDISRSPRDLLAAARSTPEYTAIVEWARERGYTVELLNHLWQTTFRCTDGTGESVHANAGEIVVHEDRRMRTVTPDYFALNFTA